MAQFLLVHGAWQGGWCWQHITPQLEARGHQVMALDLPGYGMDSARAMSTTLDDYTACVMQAIARCEEAPVLVGHSSGAGVIAQVAERVPEQVRGLIFIAGLIPAHGCSMMQFVKQFDPEYIAQFNWAPDGRSARLALEGARRFLYSACPPAVVERLLPRLQIQSVAPYESLFALSESNFGRAPKHYIRTLRDRLTSPELQEEICAMHRIVNVHSLAADHSPTFSAPEELTALLDTIAHRF
jgi:pimeloyl-ACP methyl ester carboxylesterase